MPDVYFGVVEKISRTMTLQQIDARISILAAAKLQCKDNKDDRFVSRPYNIQGDQLRPLLEARKIVEKREKSKRGYDQWAKRRALIANAKAKGLPPPVIISARAGRINVKRQKGK